MRGVDVYRNLHNGLWSVKDRTTGRIIQHAPVVVSAQHADLVVQPAGRAKVVATGQKNVHAFIRGQWLNPYEDVDGWRATAETLSLTPISYNPYRAASFYRCDTGESLTEVKAIVMISQAGCPPYVGAML